MVPFQNTTRPAKLPPSYGYVDGKNKALWHLKGGGMKKKDDAVANKCCPQNEVKEDLLLFGKLHEGTGDL